MRTNKFAILLVGPLTLSSLAAAIVFYINRYTFESFEFVANVFSGVFASGLLALILAGILLQTLENTKKRTGHFKRNGDT